MLFKFAWTHTPEARDETVKKFMEENSAAIQASGHILETTISEIYVN